MSLKLRWMTIQYHPNKEEAVKVTVLVRFETLAKALWKLQKEAEIEVGEWKRIMHLITCRKEVGYRITVKTFFGRVLYTFN